MNTIQFPDSTYNIPDLTVGGRISVTDNKNQMAVVAKRDEYILETLSSFDAIPIGFIFISSIRYSESSVPKGWILASGQEIDLFDGTDSSKTDEERLADSRYYKLYQTLYDSGRLTVTTYDKRSTYNLKEWYGFYVYYSDVHLLKVPNLNSSDGIYIRGDVIDNYGKYYADSVGKHTHDITAYAINSLSADANEFGAAIVDNDSNDSVPANVADLNHKLVTVSNSTTGSETRPKSIAYTYLIKVTYVDFSDTVDSVNANTLDGYETALSKTASSVPVSQSDGYLSSDWLNYDEVYTNMKDKITTAVSSDVSSLIKDTSDTFVSTKPSNSTDEDENANVLGIKTTTSGYIDSSFLNFAEVSDVESLFTTSTD